LAGIYLLSSYADNMSSSDEKDVSWSQKHNMSSIYTSCAAMCCSILTNVLPAFPKVDSLKCGVSGDIRNSNTSLVISNSLNASFKHSDCKISKLFYYFGLVFLIPTQEKIKWNYFFIFLQDIEVDKTNIKKCCFSYRI
jgi:hypothetical protein